MCSRDYTNMYIAFHMDVYTWEQFSDWAKQFLTAALVTGSNQIATSGLCEAVVINYQHCPLSEICQITSNSLDNDTGPW